MNFYLKSENNIKNKRKDMMIMTDRIKLTVFIAVAAMAAVIAIACISSGGIYKNHSGKGTFVYEPIEETETWMFI